MATTTGIPPGTPSILTCKEEFERLGLQYYMDNACETGTDIGKSAACAHASGACDPWTPQPATLGCGFMFDRYAGCCTYHPDFYTDHPWLLYGDQLQAMHDACYWDALCTTWQTIPGATCPLPAECPPSTPPTGSGTTTTTCP